MRDRLYFGLLARGAPSVLYGLHPPRCERRRSASAVVSADVGRRAGGVCRLIANDFISRMDLWPWACALYVAEHMRGHAYGRLLLDRAAKRPPRRIRQALPPAPITPDYMKKWGFRYLGQGYHPWDAGPGFTNVLL